MELKKSHKRKCTEDKNCYMTFRYSAAKVLFTATNGSPVFLNFKAEKETKSIKDIPYECISLLQSFFKKFV
jgi:hypothetical protein